MPRLLLDISPTSDLQPNTAGRAAEKVDLYSVGAHLVDSSAYTGEVHVQVGIFYSVPDLEHVESFLVDDYVYDGHNPTWTGLIRIDADAGILVVARASRLVTVRIVANTQRDP